VGHLGISEVNDTTLRQAHATHPLAALQSEYSLFSRDVEAEILPTCQELGISFVAYSPVGRALLTGRIPADAQFGAADLRGRNPRFSADNLAANLVLVDRLRDLAGEIGATPAQLALAWLLEQNTIPLPGTKHVTYVEENTAAADLRLTAEQLRRIEQAAPVRAVRGERHSADAAQWVGF
jgi:aryl-alcohol dehydrogenase-like predicted oxidoreductase